MTLKSILVAFGVLTSIAVGGIVLWLKSTSLSARTPPSSIETKAARQIRHLSIPSAARNQTNPLRASPELLIDARRHFADHCASCHANDGCGSTTIGQHLSPRSPDMRLAATQALSDGELYYVIHNGIRFTGMPAWGAQEPDEDSWKLVLFIRHLPQLSAAEVTDMDKFNPKGDAERAEEQAEQDFLDGKTVSIEPMHH